MADDKTWLFLFPFSNPSLFLSLDKLRCLGEDEDPEVIPENTDLVTLWYDFVLLCAICFGAGGEARPPTKPKLALLLFI